MENSRLSEEITLIDTTASGSTGVTVLPEVVRAVQVTGRIESLIHRREGIGDHPISVVREYQKHEPLLVRRDLFELLRRPTTIRETWLVLGKTLSKTAMERAIKNDNPPAALLQSFYLLSSTYSQCKSVGVDLKVFCSE